MKRDVERDGDLGTGSVGRLLFRLALPAIAAQLINVLYNMVDRMYIGHIPESGASALTGVGVTMPVILAISAFAALVSMGGAPRASIMMGRQDRAAAEKIMGNCMTMLLVLSLLLTGVLLLFGRSILLLFGASSATIGYAWDYMSLYALGTVFVQLALGMNAFITCQGFAKTSMFTVMIGAVFNIVLDPVFIFALDMGVRGAALATVISQGISALWVLRFLLSQRSLLRLRKVNFRPSAQTVLPCMALGVSPFIMQFTESILIVSFNTSLLKYGGDLAVGSMTILMSVMQFAMLPLQGLTQGSQPIVSYNYGALNGERVKKTFRWLLISCLVYSTALWGICMFFPKVFIMIFTEDAELISFSVHALRIYMASSLLLGAQIACQQTFIALGNAKASIFLALLRKVILLIPLIFLLPLFMEDRVTAVFLAEPIADFFAVCTTITLFSVSFRRLLATMKEWVNEQKERR